MNRGFQLEYKVVQIASAGADGFNPDLIATNLCRYLTRHNQSHANLTPTSIFTDIADTIRQHLQTATTEILVNVPWFTDQSLFHTLLNRAGFGVAVSVGIEDDPINRKAAFDHIDLTRVGGRVYLNQSGGAVGLNHEKYCVIDRRLLLFGSYNWTYRADLSNRESILLLDDPATIQQYCLRFAEMTQLPSVRCVGPSAGPDHADSRAVFDPALPLRLEIVLLEAEIRSLETEKLDLENRLDYTANRIRLALHDLLVHKLNLEAQLAARHAEQTDKAADHEQARQFRQQVDEAETAFGQMAARQQQLDTSVDETALRKMYREACVLTHPDKFADRPALQERATRLMSQLAEAYQQKDIDAVRVIWQQLRDGVAFGLEGLGLSDRPTLHRICQTLHDRKARLLADLDALRKSGLYVIMTRHDPPDAYIAAQRQQLQTDIDLLTQLLANAR